VNIADLDIAGLDIAALVTLAFVASITPGPNNLLLLASGMNHGIRRTLPHLVGVSLGFALLMFVVALGLGTIFDRYAVIELILRLLGGAYLASLAWRIFTTEMVAHGDGTVRPMTFLQAVLFQWVNPKAWVMATTATSTVLVTSGSVAAAAATLTVGFWIVNLPCITSWMFSGAFAARWMDDPTRVRRINRSLGVLLAGTVVLVVA
jgi:threonine/homoserine/homoserine lactone efflux protein